MPKTTGSSCVHTPGVNPISCAFPRRCQVIWEKISISPQAERMRLLVVEQGMDLHIWIHSNEPVNQILWSKMRGGDGECSSLSAKWKQRGNAQWTKMENAHPPQWYEGLMEGLCAFNSHPQMCGRTLRAESKCKHALLWWEKDVHRAWRTLSGNCSQVWKLASLAGCIHSC